MSRIISTYRANLSAKKEAFAYQFEAFNTIKDLNYSAIFHEQGLGKTKIAVDLLLYWLRKRNIDTVLIVTKKQLVKNWQDELTVHTYIKPSVLSNNKKDNFYVLNSPTKIIITNFETISTDKLRIELFLKCRNVAIIIDESTKLKNPKAKLTQDFFDLAPLFKIRTIMTGTPIANRPYDIWAQVYFLDFGESLGKDYSEFKSCNDLSNDLGNDPERRRRFEESVASIFERITAFSVRETKNSCGLSLPTKEYLMEYVDFEAEQKRIYCEVVHDLTLEYKRNGEVFFDDESVSLKRLLRLTQIASNPKLLNEDYSYISGKEERLTQLLQTIVARGEKCIVWSNYIDNVNYFQKKYAEYEPKKVHGSMAIADRNASIERFKTDGNCKVLFATPQAAKEGLTLTVANNVIFYDRGFNLDDYLQAQDRIHRISQSRKCYIYNLIMNDSIDIWIDKLLQAKQYAASLAQGDIDIDHYKEIADYGYGEIIRDILSGSEV